MNQQLVTPGGLPLRRDGSCPQCGHPKEKRVMVGGFGREPHEVCSHCGYEFKE